MFPSDSITWVQTYVYFDAADNKEFIYTGDKDTIQGNECHIVSYPIENIKYFIHEDLENGKTQQYFIDMFNEDTLKFLLMDLNLNINDSIIYNYYRRFPHDTIYVHVSKIDTIANLKIIEFDSPINYLSDDLSLKYIEGIGSNFGLVYPIEFSQILCKLYHEDELVYSFDTINLTCPIFTNIETYELSEDINIYPNPVESVLHISLKKGTPFPCPIYFYDLYGRELFHQNLTESETILYLPHLNTQMIFYKLMFEEYTVNGKILKQ